MMAVLRCCGEVASDCVSGYSSRLTSQMFLGATMSAVAAGKPEYTRLRLFSDYFDAAKAVGCRVSVNVWKSESSAFYGGFANVALQSLMANPALFTGAEKTVTGSATESLWPDVAKNEAGDFVCVGSPESVKVSATAELLGNLSLSDAVEAVNPVNNLASRALDLTGISVKPGDVIILAPKIEEVSTGEGVPVAYWGMHYGGDAVAARDMSQSYAGVHPYFMFA